MRLLSLFSGIGAFEKALKNIGIDYELVNYCEIDTYASKSYCELYNVDEGLNLWDITKINIENLPKNIDMITHGSPCQDFSSAGLGKGGDEDSNTRSSLMWNTVEIVKYCKPKYVIWENVKNVLSKNHKHNFDKYLKELECLGYTNYWKVLNSKDFGVPQFRERIFVVSILNNVKKYEFPQGVKLTKCVKDILEDNCDEKYYIKNCFINNFIPKQNYNQDYEIKKEKPIEVGYIKKSENGKKHQSNTVYNPYGLCGALFAQEYKSPRMFLLEYNENIIIKRLTPLECWRLQGFSDEDYKKVKNIKISNTQLYKQAGNSITVNALEAIFKNLFLK